MVVHNQRYLHGGSSQVSKSRLLELEQLPVRYGVPKCPGTDRKEQAGLPGS